MPAFAEGEATVRLAIAALLGIAAGLEREWSGHAEGPHARFAGLRTFLLLGVVGGVAGLLIAEGAALAGALMVGGAMALAVAGFVAASRPPAPDDGSDVDGTTEAAAIAIIALGALAGVGHEVLAAGTGALLVLALREKTRLHWFVRKVSEPELRGAMQFGVLALVVLPLLPQGPFLGVLEVRPRLLWSIVLFFSGLNYVSFVARRLVGPGAGYTITGMLGGLLSSTAVTLEFSRRSREDRAHGVALARGTVGACVVLLPRIIVVSSVLDPRVGWRLAVLLAPALALGAAMVLRWRAEPAKAGRDQAPAESANPLQLAAAIRLALAFQVSLSGLDLLNDAFGLTALYPAAAALGLTDMDALVVSMSQLRDGVTPWIAAQAIAIGVVSNTVLKSSLAAAIGRGEYRATTLRGLAVLALGSLAALALGWR